MFAIEFYTMETCAYDLKSHSFWDRLPTTESDEMWYNMWGSNVFLARQPHPVPIKRCGPSFPQISGPCAHWEKQQPNFAWWSN